MTTDLIPVSDLERMAAAVSKSGLFGAKTAEQALALMLVAQAEGRHPASAARDYDVISGRPAKRSEAMLRDFLAGGGKVEWHALNDKVADATFSHPAGGSVRITWDMPRAKTAGLGGKDMWAKYPRQMLRSRCVSEGVRTIWPSATSGFYETSEVADFTPAHQPQAPVEIDVTPAVSPDDEVLKTLEACAKDGLGMLQEAWVSIEKSDRIRLKDELPRLKEIASAAKGTVDETA